MIARFCAALALCAMAVAAGCATPPAGIESPTVITEAKRQKVKTGLSREELASILGEPESRLVNQDGEALFFKDVNLSSAWIQLDKNGKVKNWEWSK